MAESAKETTETKTAPKPRKKKKFKNVLRGIVHISATFNNTIVTFTDPKGDVISWSTSGACGFKGSKKSTPFAAQRASEIAGRKAMEHGLKEVDVVVKGPGGGRESAIRGLQTCGIRVLSIKDATPVPHNGCRPKKRRRV